MKNYSYPLTIIMDRYGGAYSGAEFTAWNLYEYEIPSDANADDCTCAEFWFKSDIIVGKGNTPDLAAADLIKKLADNKKQE